MAYVTRAVEQRLQALLRACPAEMLVGPRQSGKSTLVHRPLSDWTHLDLERPTDLALLTSDPDASPTPKPTNGDISDDLHDTYQAFPTGSHKRYGVYDAHQRLIANLPAAFDTRWDYWADFNGVDAVSE
ncbi:MAG: hypothetical protein IAG13_21615 [Deltaproteobacteria bacterium]|nr:hypothetical protein [Nannocystaceae bacterium]